MSKSIPDLFREKQSVWRYRDKPLEKEKIRKDISDVVSYNKYWKNEDRRPKNEERGTKTEERATSNEQRVTSNQ